MNGRGRDFAEGETSQRERLRRGRDFAEGETSQRESAHDQVDMQLDMQMVMQNVKWYESLLLEPY
jgi:hypothetical protein